MSDNIKTEFIECPYCKAQYLPVEVYIPDAFFGRPTYIERDSNHKIIDIVGPHTNPNEHFTCTRCNKSFKVFTKMQFITKAASKYDFEEDYTTSLKKKSLFMDED